MAISVNPTNPNRVVDRTKYLTQIPINYQLTEDLKLFRDIYTTQREVELTQDVIDDGILTHRNWDERNQTVGRDKQRSVLVRIPHTPADDAIYPNDIEGVISTAEGAGILELESVANVRAQKMIKLRRTHAITREASRLHLIATGEVLDPRGVLEQSYGAFNFYTEFGVTRAEFEIPLGEADNPKPDLDEAHETVQDSIGGVGMFTNQVALCSPEFFNALTGNGYFIEANKAVLTPQSVGVLLGQPTGAIAGLSPRYKTVEYAGIIFVNVGKATYKLPDGTRKRFIPEGEAFLMPHGFDDLLVTYYAPPNKFGANGVNTRSQGSYWFEYMNDKQDIIEIMTEQNFLNAMLYPQAVVKLSIKP